MMRRTLAIVVSTTTSTVIVITLVSRHLGQRFTEYLVEVSSPLCGASDMRGLCDGSHRHRGTRLFGTTIVVLRFRGHRQFTRIH